MASYATVPATDLESEATLLNSKPKTKTSLLVGGVAAAAFVLGFVAAASISTTPSVSTSLAGSYDDDKPYPTIPGQIQLDSTMERGRDWMCLDIPGGEGNIENGIGLQIWECGDYNTGWVEKKHTIPGPGTKFTTIEWKESGYCLDACSGGSGGLEGQQLCLWQCDLTGNNPDQLWEFDRDFPGETDDINTIVHLRKSNPSGPVLCMDVAGGDINTNGTPVQAWECKGEYAVNQQWSLGI